MRQEILSPDASIPEAVISPQLSGESWRDDRIFVDYVKTVAGQWIAISDRIRCEHRDAPAAALRAVECGGIVPRSTVETWL